MRRKLLLGVAGAIAVLAAVAVAWIGPRTLWGWWRYDHRVEGRLQVGDRAPDALLPALGGTPTHLSSLKSPRPLVLVFGSFT